MKHIYDIAVKHIIHYFKQTAITGKSQKKVFVLLAGHNMVKHSLRKSIADICFNYPMFESTWLEDEFFFHISKYTCESQRRKACAVASIPYALSPT